MRLTTKFLQHLVVLGNTLVSHRANSPCKYLIELDVDAVRLENGEEMQREGRDDLEESRRAAGVKMTRKGIVTDEAETEAERRNAQGPL